MKSLGFSNNRKSILSAFLTTYCNIYVKNANAENFGWTLSKKFNFFNVKFTEAKFLHNCFWHNLIVYNSI